MLYPFRILPLGFLRCNAITAAIRHSGTQWLGPTWYHDAGLLLGGHPSSGIGASCGKTKQEKQSGIHD